jgi:hypothetical protein
MSRNLAVVALWAGFASLAAAQAPSAWTFQLNTRSGPDGGYNLNGALSFSSSNPTINNSGQVAIKALGSNFGVWYGTPSSGTFVNMGFSSLGDASIDHTGRIVVSNSDQQPGIHRILPGGTTSSLWTNGPAGSTSFANARVANNGLVGYRTNGSGTGQLSIFNPSANTFTSVAAGGSGGLTFVYSAALFNGNAQFGTKVDVGTSTQSEMRRYNADGSFTTLAQTTGVNSSSPYQSFFNNIGFGENGAIAFNANLGSGNRGVFWSDGTITRAIATSTTSDARPTESFNMAVLGSNVYFRAFDSTNRRALWVGDGTSLHRIVTEGDLVTTAAGTFKIGFAGTGPVFSGAPAVNDLGQVVFAAALLDPNTNADRGIGVFTANPVPEPASLAAFAIGALALTRRRKPRR